MSRAAGDAHDTAQAFLNERERLAIDLDRRRSRVPLSAITSPESKTIFRIT